MKWLFRISGGLLACLALAGGWIFAAGAGWLGEREVRGQPQGRAVPARVLAASAV